MSCEKSKLWSRLQKECHYLVDINNGLITKNYSHTETFWGHWGDDRHSFQGRRTKEINFTLLDLITIYCGINLFMT